MLAFGSPRAPTLSPLVFSNFVVGTNFPPRSASCAGVICKSFVTSSRDGKIHGMNHPRLSLGFPVRLSGVLFPHYIYSPRCVVILPKSPPSPIISPSNVLCGCDMLICFLGFVTTFFSTPGPLPKRFLSLNPPKSN